MQATVVYFSVSGKNEQMAKALDRDLREKGHNSVLVFLKPRRLVGVIGSVLLSVFSRPLELSEDYGAVEGDLLVLVGPVWASSINPVTRAFLNQLKDLGGMRAINLVCGFSPHPNVVRQINRKLKEHHAGKIVSRPVRLRDIDSYDKMMALSDELIKEVTQTSAESNA